MKLSITFNVEQVNKAILEHLAPAVETAFKNTVDKTITNVGEPIGIFADWSPSYVRNRSAETFARNPTQIRNLAFNFVTESHIYTNYADIILNNSSKQFYSVYHQWGSKKTNLPARPFINFNNSEYVDLLIKNIKDELE